MRVAKSVNIPNSPNSPLVGPQSSISGTPFPASANQDKWYYFSGGRTGISGAANADSPFVFHPTSWPIGHTLKLLVVSVVFPCVQTPTGPWS